jgi:hypothetical protein
MINKHEIMAELKAILQRAQIEPNSKYLSAKDIEILYGIPAKTILNRSNLPATHKRFIPSVRLRGGRKKYFERKVIERLINIGSTNV